MQQNNCHIIITQVFSSKSLYTKKKQVWYS